MTLALGKGVKLHGRWLWVNKKVTPKWLGLANGTKDSSACSCWWFNFDPYPFEGGQGLAAGQNLAKEVKKSSQGVTRCLPRT